MEYRTMNGSGIRTSVFGIGCMRLPLLKQPDGTTDYGKIDEVLAIAMIRQGIDAGVTYIDTAYPYHGGNSEIVTGKALQDGYRERVSLATKLPVWQTSQYEDFGRILDEQLVKLQTDHIDFYLLHSLGRNSWNKVRDLGVLRFLDEAKAAGKIRQAAFSFHDELSVFQDIINSYDWDMCQIQLNLLDEHYQAGVEGLAYAGERGVNVVIMEPLQGGLLAAVPPADIQAVWDRAETRRSQVEWAFRWLADKPQVKVILSGINSLAQLQDNLRIFNSTHPGMLDDAERQLIREVQALYRQKLKVNCTGCRYCVPCPSGVAIPDIFRIYNRYALFNDLASCRKSYGSQKAHNSDASHCIQCGRCEAACPQAIPIISKLAEADSTLRD